MTKYVKNGKKLGVLGGLGPAASAEFLRQLAAKCPANIDQEHPVVYMIAILLSLLMVDTNAL